MAGPKERPDFGPVITPPGENKFVTRSDESVAAEIRAHVRALNSAIALAATDGLKVEIETIETQTFEGPDRVTVDSKIYRPL